MKKLFKFSLLLLLFLSFSVDSYSSELIPDKLVLRNDENFGIIYTHALKANQTIYGLAKFFNTELDKIKKANPSLELTNIKLEQVINIPINTNMITSERRLMPTKSYIPVFYTIKAKDNLFRVAKIYFDQKIENVMKINDLSSMDLSIGQKLLVGWYEYDPVYKKKLAWTRKGIEVNASGFSTNNRNTGSVGRAEELRFEKVISQRGKTKVETANVDVEESELKVETSLIVETTEDSKASYLGQDEGGIENSDIINERLEEDEEVMEDRVLSVDPFENRNGIFEGEYADKPVIKSAKIRALWNSKSKDKVNLFALHATAKTNSYIEIYNPMLDRKVIAKVVGNIPPKIYRKNVELIVSPKVVQALGIMDKRFFVKVRYID